MQPVRPEQGRYTGTDTIRAAPNMALGRPLQWVRHARPLDWWDPALLKFATAACKPQGGSLQSWFADSLTGQLSADAGEKAVVVVELCSCPRPQWRASPPIAIVADEYASIASISSGGGRSIE
jgi:hypothetical protein